MRIHGLEITFTETLDETCSPAMQFLLAFTSETKEEYENNVVASNVKTTPGQLVIPKIYLTEPLNKYLYDGGMEASADDDQLTIIHMLAMVMLQFITDENAKRWAGRLDALLRHGADINVLSGKKDTSLKYIETAGQLFADEEQIKRVAEIFKARGAVLELPCQRLKAV